MKFIFVHWRLFVGVPGEHKSIVSVVGVTRSMNEGVGDDRTIASLSSTENEVFVVAIGRMGVWGIVPVETILIGVLVIVPFDTIVFFIESGSRSRALLIKPYVTDDASRVVRPMERKSTIRRDSPIIS